VKILAVVNAVVDRHPCIVAEVVRGVLERSTQRAQTVVGTEADLVRKRLDELLALELQVELNNRPDQGRAHPGQRVQVLPDEDGQVLLAIQLVDVGLVETVQDVDGQVALADVRGGVHGAEETSMTMALVRMPSKNWRRTC